MVAEYLIFDAVILLPTLALAWWGPWVADRRDIARMFIASAVGSAPFIGWDAAVAGHHWSFNPRFILGVSVLGLPIEELLFFVAVPFACLFTWTVLRTEVAGGAERGAQRSSKAAILAAAIAGGGCLVAGYEYTGLVLWAAGIAALLDGALGTHLVRHEAFPWFALAVTGFTGIFNGYLTARPVVSYNEETLLGWRVGSIPVEDFVYGLALMLCTAAVYEWLRGYKTAPSWLERWIEGRMGGYRQTLAAESVSPTYAASGQVRSRVAIIGGGLAGMSAASYLAEGGLDVVLYERNPYLGGKLAGWRVEHGGVSYPVEHGFHAFFRHYYNLNEFLARVGVDRHLKSVGRYTILRRGGDPIHFDDERLAPALNLIGLARRGVYDLGAVARPQTVAALLPLLQYEERRTFAAYDHVSYQDFIEHVQLPKDLRLAFTTFARAFFADPDRLSLAELIKSFHFYYLSHDLGLVYDYLDGNVEDKLIAPIRADLLKRGVRLCLGEAPQRLTLREDGGFVVAERQFDRVILATDVAAARRILEASELHGATGEPMLPSAMQSGQGYAVWRLWLPRRIEGVGGLPVFVAAERDKVLDAVAFVDRVDPALGQWATHHGGTVMELHCYAVPVGCSDSELRQHFRRELQELLGVSETMSPVFEFLRVAHDFTSLAMGMHASRPTTRAAVAGLYFAGDWVRLPCPAMLMEAAHLSGRLAANAIFGELALPMVPAATVPHTGLLYRAA